MNNAEKKHRLGTLQRHKYDTELMMAVEPSGTSVHTKLIELRAEIMAQIRFTQGEGHEQSSN